MRGPTGRFVMHYVEMLLAMFAGMLLLWMPLVALGRPDATELELLGMAFTMTVPMVAWMRYRGHGCGARGGDDRARCSYATFAAIGLLWAGLVEDGQHADDDPARRDVPGHARRHAAPPQGVHGPRDRALTKWGQPRCHDPFRNLR